MSRKNGKGIGGHGLPPISQRTRNGWGTELWWNLPSGRWSTGELWDTRLGGRSTGQFWKLRPGGGGNGACLAGFILVVFVLVVARSRFGVRLAQVQQNAGGRMVAP